MLQDNNSQFMRLYFCNEVQGAAKGEVAKLRALGGVGLYNEPLSSLKVVSLWGFLTSSASPSHLSQAALHAVY